MSWLAAISGVRLVAQAQREMNRPLDGIELFRAEAPDPGLKPVLVDGLDVIEGDGTGPGNPVRHRV